MKMPNGAGSVVKLSGKRRKPFAARITVGFDENGKQLYKYVSYHEKRIDALNSLSNYSQNPFDIEKTNMTLEECFEEWIEVKKPKISHSNYLGYKSAFNNIPNLHNKVYSQITSTDLQAELDINNIGRPTKKKIIVMFNQLFEHFEEYVPQLKKITAKVDIGKAKNNKYSRREKVFSKDEINKFWEVESKYADMDIILILLYTGFRISELLEIETKNVFLDDNYMIGGNKTESSKDRIVPIHSRIKKFIENRYDPKEKHLIRNRLGDQFKYSNFKRERFDRYMEDLEMKHTIHDTRHTVATLLQINGADPTAIRMILGHAGKDVTEQFYLHSDPEYLQENIELLE